jgi:hypothetical protein
VPTDPVRRNAARIATLVAVPVALAVIGVSLWTYGDSGAPDASSSPSTQATSAVSMAAQPLTEETATVCRAVVAKVPDTVRELRRRPVTGGAEQNAAYGDPALTLSCGVPAPSLPPTTQVYPLSGVCWSATAGASGTVWTTVDRTVPIAITVPGKSDGSGQSVVPLAKVIAATDPRLPTPPAGCAG